MNYRELCCSGCGSQLEPGDDKFICRGCGAVTPLFEGIPVFGNAEEIEQWTRYHADPGGAKYIANGAYTAVAPTKSNSFYSRFISGAASNVLDVGGGDGNTTSDWAERHPAATVHVMDLSLHGLKKVQRRNLPNMAPICAPADRRFPFPDRFFDVVSTVFMIEHLAPDALDRFYKEAWRVLKPEGHLVVASDTAFYDKVLHPLERFLRNGRYVRNDPTHINLMSPRQCERGLIKHGFQLCERTIHWVAGRHKLARVAYRLLPASVSESLFSTMYIVISKKSEK